MESDGNVAFKYVRVIVGRFLRDFLICMLGILALTLIYTFVYEYEQFRKDPSKILWHNSQFKEFVSFASLAVAGILTFIRVRRTW